jgi:hypothetical protein
MVLGNNSVASWPLPPKLSIETDDGTWLPKLFGK